MTTPPAFAPDLQVASQLPRSKGHLYAGIALRPHAACRPRPPLLPLQLFGFHIHLVSFELAFGALALAAPSAQNGALGLLPATPSPVSNSLFNSLSFSVVVTLVSKTGSPYYTLKRRAERRLETGKGLLPMLPFCPFGPSGPGWPRGPGAPVGI